MNSETKGIRGNNWFRRLIKILLWTTGVVLFLLIAIILLIRIESVQNYIVHKATTFISGKTKTRVEIGYIGISFPKEIIIKNIFVEDQTHDTLLAADLIGINIEMLALLSNSINIEKLRINNLRSHIYRNEKDSVFNFNFIPEAFSSKETVTEEDTSSKKMQIRVSSVELNKISVTFDDKAGGNLFSARLNELHLDIREMDIEKNKFHVNDLKLSGSYVTMLTTKITETSLADSSGPLPDIQLNKLEISNSGFNMENLPENQKINLVVGKCELINKSFSLANSTADIKKLLLENSSFAMSSTKINSEITGNNTSSSSIPWKIKAEEIDLSGINFKSEYSNLPKISKGFDSNHIDVKNLNSRIKNIAYNSENISANVHSLSFSEQSGLTLKKLSTDFLFDSHQIVLNNLELKTTHSTIKDYLSINYSSLNSIADSIGNLGIDIRLNETVINTSDILLFQPELASQSFFSGLPKEIYINTSVKGKVNNLIIPDLMIAMGDRTKIKCSLAIKGLPDAKNAVYKIEIPFINTSRKDLAHLMPGQIPDMTPENIFLSGSFNGKLSNFNTIIKARTSSGDINAKVEMQPGSENYKAAIDGSDVNAGLILKDTLFGKISFHTQINGSSFKLENAIADINAVITSAEINKYNYQGLKINGKLSKQFFDGVIQINDSNLAFDLDAKINLKKNSESYKVNFNLKGADLHKLNFSGEDLRIAAQFSADLKGSSMNTFNGSAGITNLLVIKNEKNYTIDSLLFASVNEPGKSSFNFSSSIVSVNFDGTIVPGDVSKTITNLFNSYFDTGDSLTGDSKQSFTFEMKVKNHPLLEDVLLPGLKDFETMQINGSLNSETNEFILTSEIPRLNYSGININNLKLLVNSDPDKLNYSLTLGEVSNPSVKIINTSLNGEIQNDEATINLSMKDSSLIDKLALTAKLTSLREGDYHFAISPEGLSLNGSKWIVPDDNFIRFGKNGLLFNHFELSNLNQFLAINTPAQRINEEIELKFRDFQLFTLSQLIEKDSSFVSGKLNGSFRTKKTDNVSAFIADIKIDSLKIHEIPVGNINLRADNNTQGIYNASLLLDGNENNVVVKAKYFVSGTDNKIDANVQINSLNVNSISAFSNGQIKNGTGKIKGSIDASGNVSNPDIKGNLSFSEVGFHSSFANNYFSLKNEKIEFDKNGIYLNKFTLLDSLGHPAIINGSIGLKEFSISDFDLTVKLNEFVVLNTTSADNKLFFGKLILKSNTKISGNISLPKIYSQTKMVEGSYLTVSVPESKMSNDRGEGVVVFTDPKNKINPILKRETDEAVNQTEIKGIDLSADIEIDRNSTLKILVDPVSGDSLVLRGDATMSFGIDPGGKTSLSGTYTVSEGSYRVSLQDLIRKDFSIKNGSTITWNGDATDAEIHIDAVHEQKTSPIDLVAGQIGGLSETERNTYRQVLPFQVILHMSGALLKPVISFEIDLPPRYRGAMGGTVYAKLNQLNNDASELNKQVFALLVLGRFVQEDPLASSGGGGGVNSVARQSVSKFLSQQLNRFSDKYIKGVELNFDLQSYDDYSSGNAEAKTQLAVGLKKELFNQKLSVQVGSTVNLSDNTNQSTSNELASDVTLEYKLTDDGIYRLKAFRQNQYEDVIEGPLNVTGLGLIYTRDFDRWRDLFKRNQESKNSYVPLQDR